MKEQQQYTHALTRALAELHQKWHETLASGHGLQAMIYKSMSKEIPAFLAGLDTDPETLDKVSALIRDLAQAVEKDEQHDPNEENR